MPEVGTGAYAPGRPDRRCGAPGQGQGRDDVPKSAWRRRRSCSNFAAVVLVAGIVGARVFHILEHTDSFAADPMGMIFSRSGLERVRRPDLRRGSGRHLCAALAPRCSPLPRRDRAVHDAGLCHRPHRLPGVRGRRLGNGCNMALKPDWLPTWAWAQTYDNNIYGAVIHAPGVYPTPMYETVMALACFGVLWARTQTSVSGPAGCSRCTCCWPESSAC